jgi:hypothetical protein
MSSRHADGESDVYPQERPSVGVASVYRSLPPRRPRSLSCHNGRALHRRPSERHLSHTGVSIVDTFNATRLSARNRLQGSGNTRREIFELVGSRDEHDDE